jgi:hypothetical protein
MRMPFHDVKKDKEAVETMTEREAGGPPSRFPGDEEQRALIARLIRISLTIHTIDEIFSWMTAFVVQHYHAQVAQIWAMQQTRQGSPFPTLRSVATQNQLVPHLLISSSQISGVAETLLREDKPLSLSVVDAIFAAPFAGALHQYGLNYFTGLVLRSTTSLLPAMAHASAEQIPTPLALTLCLFFNQVPSQRDCLRIDDLFHAMLPIARSRGLLQVASVTIPPFSPRRDGADDLFELIPHRNEDPATNPLASSVAIVDKQARRFYRAINDRRSVRTLCMLTRLEEKEAASVVQQLLGQSRITLYGSGGQPVEHVRLARDPWPLEG